MTILDTLTTCLTELQAIANGGGEEAADAQQLVLFMQRIGPFQNKYTQMIVQAAMKADGVPTFASVDELFLIQADLVGKVK